MSEAVPGEAPRVCRNCGARLEGEYCSGCGQRDIEVNPPFGAVVRDIAHELLDWDGKIPATLKALLFQPGRLTEDFIAGRRVRWLSPLRVYLICSLAFFVSGPVVERLTGRAAREVARLTVTDGDSTLSPDDARNRAAAVSYLRQYMDSTEAEAALDNIGELNSQFLMNVPKAMFILMPLFALVTWAAWRAGGLRYPAHLYFSLHVHAAFFAAMAVGELAKLAPGNVVPVVVGTAGLVYTTWYGIVAAKRVLGGTPGQVAVRGVVVGVVYGAAFSAVMLGLLAYSLVTL